MQTRVGEAKKVAQLEGQETYHLRGESGAGCQRQGWDKTRRCW